MYRTINESNLCMCSRKTYGYSIPFHGSGAIEKPDQFSISWNPEYGATNNCTNLHMSLPHQSILVDVINSRICSMRNAKKRKEKRNKDPRRELDPAPCPPPSSQKMEREFDGFIGS